MANRNNNDPSPFKAGILHGVLSLAVFGGLGTLAAGAIHVAGDPDEAGPTYVVSLFQTDAADLATLRQRRAKAGQAQLAALTSDDSSASTTQSEEPSLGVADPSPTATTSEVRVTSPTPPPETAPAPARGIRINGKLVNPGQSLSQVETGSGNADQVSATPAASNTVSPLANARPFENPQNKPIVSLIVGGLGTSSSRTISAIDNLPPDVTLSFVPSAPANLLRYARQKGHEVLIEVPMEPSVQGRAKPHRDTLLSNVSGEQNVLRLTSVLRGKEQIFGVITHQGDKFASNETAAAPILEYLKTRGFAFFQHSSLQRANFADIAAEQGAVFARSELNIDTDPRTSAINEQLFKLETKALEDGAALGTGFAFPVTVDTIARWSYQLRSKGILIAPASAYAATVDASDRSQNPRADLSVASLADAPSP